MLTTSLYYLLTKIVRIISELFQDSEKIIDYGVENVQLIIYSVLISVFAIFGYLVFVELIEIKCCGCNYNLKKYIIMRSQIDSSENNGLNGEGNQSVDNISIESEENQRPTGNLSEISN